jgi:putative transposase
MNYRRFGYRKLGIMLRRDGDVVNHKRLYRIYKTDGLTVARRRKRHVRYERGASIEPTRAPDQRTSIDFLRGSLVSGRRIRVPAAVDDFTSGTLYSGAIDHYHNDDSASLTASFSLG